MAAQMDVKPDQVVVTDVAYGEVAQGPAPVIVTFQIRDIDQVPPLSCPLTRPPYVAPNTLQPRHRHTQDDQLDMTKAAATDDMAGAIQVCTAAPSPTSFARPLFPDPFPPSLQPHTKPHDAVSHIPSS
jgi:hypothetical protein